MRTGTDGGAARGRPRLPPILMASSSHGCPVDPQDFTILSALVRDPRLPYGDVGRDVGLSGNAVKSRLRRMEEDGVLQGFVALPAPGVLGLQEGLLSFGGVDDAAERADDLLRGFVEVPGVRLVDVTVDGAVHARLAYADEADWDRIERAAISLVGKPPAYRFRDAPATSVDLPAPDLRVVQAMLNDGRIALKELASASGLSFKTARKRLEALLERRLVRIEPALSPAEARGAVLASAHVVLAEGARPAAVAAAMPPGFLLMGAPGARLHLAHALRPSLRAARDDVARLAQVLGVERALPSLASRRHGGTWLADALQARLARPPVPRPVPLVRTRS